MNERQNVILRRQAKRSKAREGKKFSRFYGVVAASARLDGKARTGAKRNFAASGKAEQGSRREKG